MRAIPHTERVSKKRAAAGEALESETSPQLAENNRRDLYDDLRLAAECLVGTAAARNTDFGARGVKTGFTRVAETLARAQSGAIPRARNSSSPSRRDTVVFRSTGSLGLSGAYWKLRPRRTRLLGLGRRDYWVRRPVRRPVNPHPPRMTH